jgi:hypothetical protein
VVTSLESWLKKRTQFYLGLLSESSSLCCWRCPCVQLLVHVLVSIYISKNNHSICVHSLLHNLVFGDRSLHEIPNTPSAKEWGRVFFNRHSANKLFAECGHKNTQQTTDANIVTECTCPYNTRRLQYIRWVYLCNTRRLASCRVSAKDTRQNLIFFCSPRLQMFSLVLTQHVVLHKIWYIFTFICYI